ncbi:MAG: hypothetical protein NTW21_41285 [Verrucomicrobia bacterium]|nr:hypothetical protein [Verrucomicrobiota bacterium]
MTDTLDILDASIPAAYEMWQNYPDTVRFTAYRREFTVDPKNWSRFTPADWVFDLKWREFQYATVNDKDALHAEMTSADTGVYIFHTKAPRQLYGFPSFPLYVGISGRRESGRPLRDRIEDYLLYRIERKTKRDNIDAMLRLYFRFVWVAYAYTAKPSIDLEEAEKRIHGYINPCYAVEAHPVEIKRQQRAFGTR